MYCIHCGQELPDEAQFCCKCGKPTHRPDSPQDFTASSAEDFIADETPLDLQPFQEGDLVEDKAVFLGGLPQEAPRATSAWTAPASGERYTETRELIYQKYVYRTKRYDQYLEKESFQLLNLLDNTQSEWFDKIESIGNGTFQIARNGKEGFMPLEFTDYQLWDAVSEQYITTAKINIVHAVREQNKWGIISLKDGAISILSENKYDSIFFCGNYIITPEVAFYRYDSIENTITKLFGGNFDAIVNDYRNPKNGIYFAVEKAGKYGYITCNGKNELQMAVPCILDSVRNFESCLYYSEKVIKIELKDKLFFLSRRGELFVQRIHLGVGILFISFFSLIIILLYQTFQTNRIIGIISIISMASIIFFYCFLPLFFMFNTRKVHYDFEKMEIIKEKR